MIKPTLRFVADALVAVLVTGGMFTFSIWIWDAGLSWQGAAGFVALVFTTLALMGTEH
jgi:hypothetical protein